MLMTDLHYAREMAVKERKNFTVTFTSSGYTVRRVSPAQVYITRTYPQGITGSATTSPATFYAWGLAAASNITLTNTSGSKIVRLTANGHVSR